MFSRITPSMFSKHILFSGISTWFESGIPPGICFGVQKGIWKKKSGITPAIYSEIYSVVPVIIPPEFFLGAPPGFYP